MTPADMGRLRWSKYTTEQRQQIMAELRSKRTGKRTFTEEQRVEIGRRLAAARAAKRQARQS